MFEQFEISFGGVVHKFLIVDKGFWQKGCS